MELLPAHGPVGGRAHARIDALLAHHDRRLAEMGSVLAADGVSAFEVASQVAWTSRLRKFADLDPFNQMLAVCETALHLELLVDRGRATASEIDGIRVYAPGLSRPTVHIGAIWQLMFGPIPLLISLPQRPDGVIRSDDMGHPNVAVVPVN